MNMKDFLSLLMIIVLFSLNISVFCFSTILVQASNNNPLTLNHRLHIDDTTIWVMGEVINNLAIPIGNVSVKVSFYNDGQNIFEKNTTAWLSVILPNRIAPFVLDVDKQDVEGYTDYTVRVEQYEQCPSKPVGLAFTTAMLTGIGPQGAQIEGTIKNTGSETIRNIIVIGMFYDIEGFLAPGSDFMTDLEGLSPEAEGTFKIFSKLVNQPSQFVKYILTAESKDYAIEQERVKEFPITPEDQNGGDYTIIIILLVIIASVIVAAIAVSRSKRKRKSRRHTSHRTKRSIREKPNTRLYFCRHGVLKRMKSTTHVTFFGIL